MKQIQVCQSKPFFQVQLKAILDKPENKLIGKRVFEDSDLEER